MLNQEQKLERFRKQDDFLMKRLASLGMVGALDAFDLARPLHNGIRKDGYTPEFHHQISIALHIFTLKNVIDLEGTLITIALHDTVEDKGYPLSKIKEQFGADRATSIRLISKEIDGIRIDDKDYYLAMAEDVRASLAKGGDRSNNVQTMIGAFKPEKVEAYVEETYTHTLPMLKKARRNFPAQEDAYLNLENTIRWQTELIEHAYNINIPGPGIYKLEEFGM